MLFARPHASDDFQLLEMQLHVVKYGAIFLNQIRDRHVVQMFAKQHVTMGPGLQVHLVPTTS